MQQPEFYIAENRIEILFKKIKKYLKPLDYVFKIIVIIIILFLLLESLSFIGRQIYTKYVPKLTNDRLYQGLMDVSSQNEEFVRDYYRELRESSGFEYAPYISYKTPPYNGKHINVDNDSIRLTKQYCSSENPVRIFVFGGSTLWGWGVTDKGTIPSFLSKYLCENGIQAEIINFGERGFATTQEMIKLQLELRKGNYPDIVIFYDGINDVTSTSINQMPGINPDFKDRNEDFDSRKKLNIKGALLRSNTMNLIKFLKQTLGEKNKADYNKLNNELEKRTISIYLNNTKIIKSLGKEFNFKTFFYWQPSIFHKPIVSDFEKILNLSDEKIIGDSYLRITEEIKKAENIKDLSASFDDRNQTIFLTFAHISEGGNEIIAQEIGRDIVRFLNSNR